MTIYSALGILIFATVGSSLASAQSLNVKPGQWETTSTGSQLGSAAAALPPGTLDRLPPDQRAKLEAALKGAGQPRTTVSTGCLTQEELAKGFKPGDNLPKSCSYNVTASSARQQKMTVTCDTDKAKSTGTVQVDVVDSENIKGTVQMTSAFNGQTMSNNITFSSKWLGPTCSETKSGK